MKRKKQDIKKKIFKRAVVVGVLTISATLLMQFLAVVIFIGLIGGIIGASIGKGGTEEEQEVAHSANCPCGCVWVETAENGESSVTVDDTTATGTDGKPIDELKEIGSGKMTYYTPKDNNTAGTEKADITASGADATPGITCALTKEMQNEFGVKYGDWIYIENIGVRQVQDLCGTAGKIDIYIESAEKSPEITKYNNQILKVYFIEEGTIQKGSQEGIKKPVVNTTQTEVPGYGHGTGSLTDTSVTSKIPKLTGDRKLVTDKLLPAAVAAEEYYHVRVLLSLCHAPKEAGWNGEERYTNPVGNHDHNAYGITYSDDFKSVPHESGVWYHTNEHDGVAFRSYDSFTESVLDHGRLLNSSDNYKIVASAYEQGWKAQALALAKTPYLGNDKNVSSAELEKVRQEYANKIIGFVSNRYGDWSNFDDINVCKAYLQQNGLMDEYYKALDMIKNVEYYKKGALSTPSTVPSTPDSGIGPNGSRNGYWVCDCNWPCSVCTCHDGTTEDDKNNQQGGDNGSNQGGSGTTQPPAGISIDNFKETPGVGQGIWNGKTTEELCAGTSYLGTQKSKFGRSYQVRTGSNSYNWRNSPYKVPSFSQAGTDPEGFGNIVGINQSQACHIYMFAHICSALQQRLINPPEMGCVMKYFGVVTSGGLFANSEANTKRMMNSFGYDIEFYYKSDMRDLTGSKWTELDNSLKAGIPCGYRADSYFTSDTHYMAIDAIIDGKYKLAQVLKGDLEAKLYSRDTLYKYAYDKAVKPCFFVVSRK